MTAVATPAEAVTPTVRQRFRQVRFWIGALVALVVIALAGLLANAAGSATGYFDPDSAGLEGARALRVVLEQQGVRVTVAERSTAARQAAGTLFVDDSDNLLTATDWRRVVQGRERVVVVSPGFAALETLLPGVTQAGVPDGDRADAGCDLALARRAGSMSLAGVTSSLRADDADVCFSDDSGAGQLVTANRGGLRVVLLADATAFTNERIGAAGNAAVALNALGATPDLVWYRPSPLDVPGDEQATLQELTPAWVTPVVVLLLLAFVAAALARGRRLGPVVVERLPVIVRSRETVEGRARLYARAGARLRAADALRIGAVGRMAPMLGLATTAPVDDVIGAAARATGRPVTSLRTLLLDAVPGTDRDLVSLSDDLARLEAAVRAAAVPGAAPSAPTNGAP